MIYVLDTNVLSAMRRPDRSEAVMRWAAGRREEDMFLSVITLGEVERGIMRQEKLNPAFAADLRQWLDQTMAVFSDRILPFDAAAARLWGKLSARLGHAGTDLLIAATAMAHGATVVTGDSGFAATGVRVENPFTS